VLLGGRGFPPGYPSRYQDASTYRCHTASLLLLATSVLVGSHRLLRGGFRRTLHSWSLEAVRAPLRPSGGFRWPCSLPCVCVAYLALQGRAVILCCLCRASCDTALPCVSCGIACLDLVRRAGLAGVRRLGARWLPAGLTGTNLPNPWTDVKVVSKIFSELPPYTIDTSVCQGVTTWKSGSYARGSGRLSLRPSKKNLRAVTPAACPHVHVIANKNGTLLRPMGYSVILTVVRSPRTSGQRAM
jgi:hypothetical protein